MENSDIILETSILLDGKYVGSLSYNKIWEYAHSSGIIPTGLKNKKYLEGEIPTFVSSRLVPNDRQDVLDYCVTMGVDPNDYIDLFLTFGRVWLVSPWVVKINYVGR